MRWHSISAVVSGSGRRSTKSINIFFSFQHTYGSGTNHNSITMLKRKKALAQQYMHVYTTIVLCVRLLSVSSNHWTSEFTLVKMFSSFSWFHTWIFLILFSLFVKKLRVLRFFSLSLFGFSIFNINWLYVSRRAYRALHVKLWQFSLDPSFDSTSSR